VDAGGQIEEKKHRRVSTSGKQAAPPKIEDSSASKAESQAPETPVATVSPQTFCPNDGEPMTQDKTILPKVLSGFSAPFQTLVLLMESHVGVKQNLCLHEFENLDQIDKLTPEQAEQICKWATGVGFWDSKFSGKTALLRFCQHFPTIRGQFNQKLRALQQSAKNQTMAELKAVAVAPNPEKPFQYSGEVI
jgi:hypothetical protein